MPGVYQAMNIARTGLQLQELMISVKANNLSALGVDGFKRQYVVGEDLPYLDMKLPGGDTGGSILPAGLQIGSGVRPSGIYRIFTEGDRNPTDGALDLRISGNGFFKIIMPDGTIAYTRAGAFTLSPTGQIVMVNTGHTLFPGITVPPNAGSIMITEDGQVSVTVDGQQAPQNVGQLQIANFPNPNGLKSLGGNLFASTLATGQEILGNPKTSNLGSIFQGEREGSNVNSIEEITDLIKIQRAYEMLTRVINTGDSMLDAANRVARS